VIGSAEGEGLDWGKGSVESGLGVGVGVVRGKRRHQGRHFVLWVVFDWFDRWMDGSLLGVAISVRVQQMELFTRKKKKVTFSYCLFAIT